MNPIQENDGFRLSDSAIYRSVYAGMFDTAVQRHSKGNRDAVRMLHHRGKTRRRKEAVEARGKIVISILFRSAPKRRMSGRADIEKPIPQPVLTGRKGYEVSFQ